VRQYLAVQRSDRAASVLAADPRAALAGTRSALRLDDSRPETYYTRAAAFARLGDYPDARATLLEAVRIEPLNYVPWALLGDLATRRGAAAAASAAYRRAAALDSRDAALFAAPTG
jgi:Tfp pilus assembly protein PilF